MLNALHKSKYQLISIVTPIEKPKGRGKKTKDSAFKTRAKELEYPILEIDDKKSSSFSKSFSFKNI